MSCVAWFTASFPPCALDGELFLARGSFDTCVSIARRSDASDAWKQLRYVVFDAPKRGGTFEQRYEVQTHTHTYTVYHTHTNTQHAHLLLCSNRVRVAMVRACDAGVIYTYTM